MSGFRERLRAAMLAAGIRTEVDLARRCGLPVATVLAWIESDGRCMLAVDGVRFMRVCNARMLWLLDGDGPIVPLAPFAHADEAMALVLLANIPAAKRPFWFGIGRRLAKK